jgi:hypothetical protein
VEGVIASGLLVLLALLLANTWQSMGRAAIDAVTRGRITQEANLALAALASDLGGSLSDPQGRVGSLASAAFVGRLQPGGNQLWLCFDGGSTPNGIADWGPPDTVVSYELQSSQLVRINQATGVSVPVAQGVSGFAVQDLGDRVQIQLTLTYRNLTRTFTLIARDP